MYVKCKRQIFVVLISSATVCASGARSFQLIYCCCYLVVQLFSCSGAQSLLWSLLLQRVFIFVLQVGVGVSVTRAHARARARVRKRPHIGVVTTLYSRKAAAARDHLRRDRLLIHHLLLY